LHGRTDGGRIHHLTHHGPKLIRIARCICAMPSEAGGNRKQTLATGSVWPL